jgi:secreted PhoX family phosphatase
VLTAEENINQYISGAAARTRRAGRELPPLRRRAAGGLCLVRASSIRFNLDSEPNEPNRFGWTVEFDPNDPASGAGEAPATGRFTHEGATPAVSRWTAACCLLHGGTTSASTYVYKFRHRRPWNPDDRGQIGPAGRGPLFVARFHDDGRMDGCRWCTARAR